MHVTSYQLQDIYGTTASQVNILILWCSPDTDCYFSANHAWKLMGHILNYNAVLYCLKLFMLQNASYLHRYHYTSIN